MKRNSHESKIKLITNAEIADFAPYDRGFVFSEIKPLESGAYKIAFFSYDCETEIITPITKRAYSELKFGIHGNDIANALGSNGEFITADCARFYNNLLVTLDPEGSCTIFSPKSELMQKWKLLFGNSPARSPVAYDRTLWCAVPEKNAIIHYSIEDRRVLLIVGGEQQKTFAYPTSITLIDGRLFICNRDSGKIRVLQIVGKYAIADYQAFEEPVYKYYRICDRNYALLESGIYEF